MPAVLERLDRLEGPASRTPLILIHDGGGTIFEYYMLGPLYRHTYGIPNPYYHDGGSPPAGGVPQLAKEYAEAIQATIRNGPILIGGWSLGGMISLETARLLQENPSIQVIGLLLIDSMCPWSEYYRNRGGARPSYRPMYRPTTSEKTKVTINRCFDAARDMILSWDRPPTFNPPRAVLIRASEAMGPIDVPDGSQTSTDADGMLGWSEYESLRVLSVIEAPGNHFSMFADNRLDGMTSRIREACTSLERAYAEEASTSNPGTDGQARIAS